MGKEIGSRTYSISALLLCLPLLLAGCGGGAASAPVRSTDGFGLSVHPGSFEPGGRGEFELAVAPEGELVRVDVVAAEAAALKALYFELGYDAGRYTPVGAQATGLLAGGSPSPVADNLLELHALGTPGRVTSGQILARFQQRPGFSGGGVLARVWLARRPMPRGASATPVLNSAKVDLDLDANAKLSWSLVHPGDYNQDGLVSINDLTPLGASIGQSVAPSKFPPNTALSVVDGNDDGLISINDLTPVGANLNLLISKYVLFSSLTTADYPAANGDGTALTPLAELDVKTQMVSPWSNTTRKRFELTLGTPQEAAYYWVRPADSSGNYGTPSNSVQYFSPNAGPTADVSADVTSGDFPLTVNFDASASTDSDGSIVKYEFDWDGARTNHDWLNNGSVASASFTFTTEGVYDVMLRVTDDGGASSVDQVAITVTTPQFQAPSALLLADDTFGAAPHDVNFDASGSSDPDGTIVTYEWDFDGDGVFETNTGATAQAFHSYMVNGLYDAAVRVTDDDGLTDEASVTITVSDAPQAPVADLQLTPDQGDIPLNVTLDASGSTDLDGSITLYEWDFDGDGIMDDSGTAASIQHTYTDAGVFNPTVRVTDDTSLIDEASAPLACFDPGAPAATAVLRANPRYGPAPLNVDFDATGSFSNGGNIVLYEWDWDGDGTYDEATSNDGTVAHSFGSAGTYDATVRVTDDADNTDTETMLVLATDGSFPLDDSVFALPSQSTAQAGDVVGVEIYTHNAANPFLYMNGVRLLVPLSTELVKPSYNVGAFGGDRLEGDGVWTNVVAPLYLDPEQFLQMTDHGGGLARLDLNVTPLAGIQIDSGATGAMVNVQLRVHETVNFTFQREDGIARTYYQDQFQGTEYFWLHDDNAGMPGITVMP
jgi:PKD repeat protein